MAQVIRKLGKSIPRPIHGPSPEVGLSPFSSAFWVSPTVLLPLIIGVQTNKLQPLEATRLVETHISFSSTHSSFSSNEKKTPRSYYSGQPRAEDLAWAPFCLQDAACGS